MYTYGRRGYWTKGICLRPKRKGNPANICVCNVKFLHTQNLVLFLSIKDSLAVFWEISNMLEVIECIENLWAILWVYVWRWEGSLQYTHACVQGKGRGTNYRKYMCTLNVNYS